MKPQAGLELQGRYALTERIALGGMGEVWRATDLRSGRAVAAKILRPELAGDDIFLSRLRAEAANSRGLRHPNLAVVLDSGEREGSGWIIMELVQGRPLSDILDERGTMTPAEILPILAQVARALQVVHDAHVVHRDVKPSNILINRQGLAKLTDFGISTGVHQRPLTATGMVMGTAQYLSPEQAMGQMATPAGDIYALGIIAYEALIGQRPFTGATQVDIAFAHVNEPVPQMPDSLHPEVRDVVRELLAKNPADRPRSARELARRLDRIVIHLPEEAWDPREGLSWAATGRQVADVARTDAGASPSAAVSSHRPSATASDVSRGRSRSIRGHDGGAGDARGQTKALPAVGQSTGKRPVRPTGPSSAARPALGDDAHRVRHSTSPTVGRWRLTSPVVVLLLLLALIVSIVLIVALVQHAHGATRVHSVVSSPVTSFKEAL